MPTAAAPITAVASHPRTASRFVSTNSPITALRDAMSMIITMIGTAATPFMMALQISALTGSRGVKLPPPPTWCAARGDGQGQDAGADDAQGKNRIPSRPAGRVGCAPADVGPGAAP